MLAILGGTTALLLGLLILLLPLLAPELSRPRDSVWGALVLLLGLVLVTSAERLSGSPMLAVLSGGLLIGRLGTEVGQGRWLQLTPEERQRLWSAERWQNRTEQLMASISRLVQIGVGASAGLGEWIRERRASGSTTKRWVRPEAEPPDTVAAAAGSDSDGDSDEKDEEKEATPGTPDVIEVSGFDEINDLLEASEGTSRSEAG